MKAFRSAAVVVLLCLLFTRNAIADVTIDLNSYNESITRYTDFSPFRMQYANVPDDFVGFVHQPFPSNGCGYITPLPKSVENYSWIALIDNYSLCTEQMIDNVRNAGYQLIVAYSSGDKQMTVDNYIRNSGFGVVVISDYYVQTLYHHRIIDINDTNPETAVNVTVSGFAVSSPAMVTSIFLTALFCCCWALCCCLLYCRRRSNQQLAGQVAEIEGRRRNFERVQRQERLARQELIESILRQLQELQVDLRSQAPLGEDETRKLPTRKYRRGGEKIERCAICVEDFQDGDGLRVLPCEHCFHRQCIDEWLINHSAVCPLCKFEVSRGGQAERPAQSQERERRRPVLVETDEGSSTSLEAISPLLPPPPHTNAQRSSSQNTARQYQYGSV